MSNTAGMQIVLMSNKGKLKTLWLSNSIEGKYRFEQDEDDGFVDLVYIEVKKNKWYAYCQKPAYFVDSHNKGNCVELYDECRIGVKNAGDIWDIEEKCVLYAEVVDEVSAIFHNYQVKKFVDIVIGRSKECDVVCSGGLISGRHAVLRYEHKCWRICDTNSTNGTYVNGKKISQARLEVGDEIYIMGLRIIIGVGFISINDGNNRIFSISKKLYRVLTTNSFEKNNLPANVFEKNPLFNRLPRRRKLLEENQIVIDPPPYALNSSGVPTILRMGGSMVMSGSALLAGNITMVLSSVLFPLLTQKYTEKQKKEYEEKRQKKYNEYLITKAIEIQRESERETDILNSNYPELSEVLKFAETETRLWERRNIDDDFLSIRLGYGKRPLLAELEYPKRGFDLDEDPLMKKMYELAETPVVLSNVPIMISFVEDYVCGVLGKRLLEISFVKRLIMQLTILHSYDELKIVFLVSPEELKTIEFIKYLPHIWNDQKNFRFLATETSSAYQISEYLKQEIETEKEQKRDLKNILKSRPYYMIFALDKRIFDSMEVLKDIMQSEKNMGFTVLTIFDDLPKECHKIVDLKQDGVHLITPLKQIDKDDDMFVFDNYSEEFAIQCMKKISNTCLKIVSQAYSLPKMVTFLEMYGVGRVEHLNPLKRWKDNDPVKSLVAPIGIATDGTIFSLDLHQKYQGPHGLVAGMTGSGKSEFILTYILSMAVNYHPDEVAFILIDYKGGGLTGAFEDRTKGIRLPHVVGTITNLDGPAIQRSLISLQSELKRRQRVFNEAKSLLSEGTMDIYDYQRLYRQKAVEEPMPHLFIISDEFAELKQQEPEFMDQLISIARIGRSLGVHLILATQKPAGVVNEQIRSNTKFRVCLKVQDRMDSMDMLKRPEAAELKETGRFYLQVGYNEFFALGQSAWCGAPYEPQEEVVIKKDDAIQFVDSVGQTVYLTKPEAIRSNTGKTQLVALVQALSKLAKEEGIVERSLWKPALANVVDIESLDEELESASAIKKTTICTNIGMIDAPEEQEQFPLLFDFQECKNLLIVGEQGSGKTTLVQSMIVALAKKYSPEQVNFYILDYSSRMLKTLKKLPHCGAVLTEEDENLIDAFFDLLNNIVQERKQLFSELEVDSYESANRIEPIPLVLVFIDNIAGFLGTKKGESYSYKLQEFLKNSVNYGVKYIITCTHLNELSMRVKQELVDRISLNLKDRYEYSEAIGCRCNYLPPKVQGRGLYNYEGKPLEMQVAMYSPNMEDVERIKKLKQDIEDMNKKWSRLKTARQLPIISDTETYMDFARKIDKGRIPLGYSLKDAKMVGLPFKQFSMLSVYFGNPQGVVPVLENFLYAASVESMETIIVKREKDSCFDEINEMSFWGDCYQQATVIASKDKELVDMCRNICKELVIRKNLLLEYCNEAGFDAKQKDIYKYAFPYMRKHTTPLLILFESFADVCNNINEAFVNVLCEIFKLARQYNLYIIGCFGPGESNKLMGNPLFKAYNPDELIMMFGGQVNQQILTNLPREFVQKDTIGPYNRCLMKYKNRYYALLMPCGELISEKDDEDGGNIFE